LGETANRSWGLVRWGVELVLAAAAFRGRRMEKAFKGPFFAGEFDQFIIDQT